MSLAIPKVDLSSVSVTTRWHHEYYCSSQQCLGNSTKPEHQLRSNFMKYLSLFELLLRDMRQMRLVEFLVKFVPEEEKLAKLRAFCEMYQQCKSCFLKMTQYFLQYQQLLANDSTKALGVEQIDTMEDYLTIAREFSLADGRWNTLLTEGTLARLPLVLQTLQVAPELYSILIEKKTPFLNGDVLRKTPDRICCPLIPKVKN